MPTFLPALIAALAATCVQIATAETTVIYVNASAVGAHDGSSWTDAFVDLQDALAVAQEGRQIWVAAGTYAPGPPDVGPVHFHLVSSVGMYGGFAGWESQLDQRDWNANETILNGDLDGNGVTNGYQVVIGTALTDAVLDGFTIRNGWAAGSSPDEHGGALRLVDSSVHIANCTFTVNGSPSHGGAIYALDSSLTLDECEFTLNGWVPGIPGITTYGGAIYAENSDITAWKCVFHSNNASDSGAGIYAHASTLILDTCHFDSNFAADFGGAIRGVDVVLEANDCTFVGNNAEFGGGAIRASGSVILEECLFQQNTTIFAGAAVHGGDVHMKNCVVQQNGGDGHALFGGGNWTVLDSVIKNNAGGLFLAGASEVLLRGCEFISNHIDGGDGAGAWIGGSASAEITDCLFDGNSADIDGGGLMLKTSGFVMVANCHFWGNQANFRHGGGIMAGGTGTVYVIDSLFEDNGAAFGAPASVRDGSLIIERCTVKGNFGGLHANRNGLLTVIDSIITDNFNEGILSGFENGPPGHATIINSLIANNNGDGVRVGWDGPPSFATIINSTIVNNKINFPGWQAGVFVETGHANIRNSIIWGNKPANGEVAESHQINVLDGTVDVSHSLIHMLAPGGEFDAPGATNIGDDPLFVNPNPSPESGEEADFRLQAGSPAIDAGSNAYVPDDITTDLDGNPRIIDGTGDGFAVVDIGAYEFQPAPSIPGDLTGDGTVGVPDLLILLGAWGECAVCTTEKCPADLDRDCIVGVPDLLILLANWG